MARISKSWGRGVMAVLAALAVAGLLNGCGGGGDDDCEVTGERADVYFTPSVPLTGQVAQDALTYKLNQRNTWTLQARGMTQACLKGLKVEVRDPQFGLPAGFTLNETTGTIESPVMTRPIEGTCFLNVTNANGTTTQHSAASINRVCPADYKLMERVTAVIVTSDRYNQSTRVVTAVAFQPAP
ncbi:hypothetical protein ACFJIX_19565 [Roseateles sp. UC29_93]|uniref:hypothetical protein n=1 Tax=Roseateles sp. UC29_93 TaxID=3350177 RepID=UPI0036724CD2